MQRLALRAPPRAGLSFSYVETRLLYREAVWSSGSSSGSFPEGRRFDSDCRNRLSTMNTQNINLTFTWYGGTESFEGFEGEAYPDGGGVWTIGYGHTRGVTAGQRCSLAQAQTWLRQDMSAAIYAVQQLVSVPLTQGQFNALCDFEFNTGALGESTLLKLLNSGDYAGAAAEFPKWVHDSAGNIEPGLVKRRAAEVAMFNSLEQAVRS